VPRVPLLHVLTLGAGLGLTSSACSKSDVACEPAIAARIDATRACLLPPAQIAGVNLCRGDAAPADAGAVATCVVDSTGRYVMGIPPGWYLVGEVRTPPEPCAGFLDAPTCAP
jgi:hypothetical protein